MKKVLLFLIFYSLVSSVWADSMYFQITSPKSPESLKSNGDIVIWSKMHSSSDEAMNFIAKDMSGGKCRVSCSATGPACSSFFIMVEKYISYRDLWNKISHCQIKNEWPFYLDIKNAGGSKTFDLPLSIPKQ